MPLSAIKRILSLREAKTVKEDDDIDIDNLTPKDIRDLVRRLKALEDKADAKDDDDDSDDDDKKSPKKKSADKGDKDDDKKSDKKKPSDKDDDKDDKKKSPFEKSKSKDDDDDDDDDKDDKKKPVAKKSSDKDDDKDKAPSKPKAKAKDDGDDDDDEKSPKKASKPEKKPEVAKDDDKGDKKDKPVAKKDSADKDDDEKSKPKKADEKKPEPSKDAQNQKPNTGKDKDDIAVDEPPDTTKVKIVIDPPKKLRPESKVLKFKTFIKEALEPYQMVYGSMSSRMNKVNRVLADMGRKYYPRIPINDMFELLKKNGFEPTQEDGTPWSGMFLGRDGRAIIELRDMGTGEMTRKTLAVQWHKMDVSGNYEVTAYVS